MKTFGLLHLALLAVTIALLVARHFTKPKPLRYLLTVLPLLPLIWIFLGFAAIYYPKQLAFAVPYKHVARCNTTDVDGNPCVVDLYFKDLGVMNPPGEFPRFKVVGNSPGGRASTTHDTQWRFWAGSAVKAVPGGIGIFWETASVPRLLFLLKEGTWTVTEPEPPSDP